MTFAKLGEKIASFFNERTDYGTVRESLTRRQLYSYFEHHRFEDLLPYETYDPYTQMFFNKKSVGFIIEVTPLVGSSQEMQRTLSGLFEHTLPEKACVQFLLYADAKIGPFLNQWQVAREDSSPTLKKLAASRVDYLASKAYGTLNSIRDFRCIVSYSQKGGVSNPIDRERLLDIKSQLITSFETLGMSAFTWDAAMLLQFLGDVLNLNQSLNKSPLFYNPYNSIKSQIVTSPLPWGVTPGNLIVDEGKFDVSTYSIKRAPDLWSLHAMGDLIGDQFQDFLQIPCPFLLHYGVRVANQSSTANKVLGKGSYVDKQAHSPIGKFVPSLVTESQEHAFVREQVSKGARFVETCFSAVLFAPDKTLSQAEQILLNLFRSKQWDLIPDRYIQLQSFLSTLPMIWGEGMVEDLGYFRRTKTTMSSESANLLPIQGEWKGTLSSETSSKGTLSRGMIFTGRRGQIFTWSSFDNDAGNYNVCVVGRSGSGKSVFMQELITSTLGLGGRVFVLDVGRSFEKTCLLLEGQFIEFTTRNPICLNPFSAIPQKDRDEQSDALSMLKSIVALMAAPTKGTDDIENAIIEQAILQVWKQKETAATLTDVANWLKNQKDLRAQDLGVMLIPYTEKGIYGRFFNGAANVDFHNKLVVLEMEELKERKDLQAVIVQMVIMHITNQMFLGDRKTPFNIVFDEAWDMLRGKQSGVFIETLARRLRKYNGSLVVGTQSVNDFFASAGAQAAYDNSDWMCLLSQKKESIDQLKKSGRVSMDSQMEALLTSVRTKQGEYAEVMISGPHGYAIGRLILDPFSKMLYSTKADEYAAVKSLQAQGMTLTQALETLVEKKDMHAKDTSIKS